MEAPVILNLKRGPIGRPQKRPMKDLFKAFLVKVNPKAPREGRPHREDQKSSTKFFIQGGPKEKVSEKAGSKWMHLDGALMELQPNTALIVVLSPHPKEVPRTSVGPLQGRPPKNVLDPNGVSKVPPIYDPRVFRN